jgi:hypothetical protein
MGRRSQAYVFMETILFFCCTNRQCPAIAALRFLKIFGKNLYSFRMVEKT